MENNRKSKSRFAELMKARDYSTKNSALRQLGVVSLEFINLPVPTGEVKTNEQGEEVEEKREPEVAFSMELNGKLEHYGALYLKYLKFKEKVALMPLAPDREVIEQITQIQQIGDEYRQWL